MDFYLRATRAPSKLAILPGAFNPPTRAHMAMAEAALSVADEVLFVLPRAFPHKEYSGAPFDQRLAWLRAALGGNLRFSLAASDRGLFIDIAREAQAQYNPSPELFVLCGRDAAERIVSWDYGEREDIRKQLEVFALLVASRGGHYHPPQEIGARVVTLALPPDVEEISSTEVRRRIQCGEAWESLVPPAVAPMIR
jgi:nicotinate (nicotinamide) nucleotide adenylyltransferase